MANVFRIVQKWYLLQRFWEQDGAQQIIFLLKFVQRDIRHLRFLVPKNTTLAS